MGVYHESVPCCEGKKQMILDILKHPDERLRQVSKPVEPSTFTTSDEFNEFVMNMIETMYVSRGIGLAAIQVGNPIRLLVMDVGYHRSEDGKLVNPRPMVMINPVISEKEGEAGFEEGCLSVPGVHEIVKRAAVIKLEWTDGFGRPHVQRFGKKDEERLFTVCVQHELDHLDGKLFIDYENEKPTPV